MHRPRNVLIVIDNLRGGGAQEFILQLCKNISRDKINITVCALHCEGTYREKFENIGFPVRVLSQSPTTLVRVPNLILKLYKLLRSKRYDVVQTVLQWSFAVTTPLSRLVKLPTVHSVMAIRKQVQPWYFFLLRWYERWVSLYITPIPDELTEIGINENKIKLLEVTVDLRAMYKVNHDAQLEIDDLDLLGAYPIALSIGRLHPDKGHEYAIAAWRHVLSELPNATLLVVGEGPDGKRLKDLTESLGLSNSVKFTGYRDDLVRLFSKVDLFLFTSMNEGVNLTVIQAMAAGLPVIAFRKDVPRQIIVDGRSGLRVPLMDDIAMAKAVVKLVTDRQLAKRLGKEGRRLVQNYYDIAAIARLYEKYVTAIYNSEPLDSLPDMTDLINSFKEHFSAED